MSDMSRDDEYRYFKCKDELLNDQIFEVFFFLTTYVLFLSELMDY